MRATERVRRLKALSRSLSAAVADLPFTEPVAAVYNPLVYARDLHEHYLDLAGQTAKEVLFLGMNPGPWGMAQTGVPFGEIPAVRDWMGLRGRVSRPAHEHPKRPVEGLACRRSEVSGRRLWGLFQEAFPDPSAFFRDHFVANYCPLVFMAESGANLTPDKLPVAERIPLETACQTAFRELVRILEPEWVIGVGKYADSQARKALEGSGLIVRHATILHPSPASPIANRGWAPQALKQLQALGLWEGVGA
ncbi:MAG: uracil-DNA glycosylase family protein [Opitutales bacterium]